MKKSYEIGFVFFIASDEEDAVERKDSLLDALDTIKEIESYDVYNDGEDWNIECTATISTALALSAESCLVKLLNKKNVPMETWDFHYIKGIDNDYYWQP